MSLARREARANSSNMKSLEHRRPYANELIGAHSTGPVTAAPTGRADCPITGCSPARTCGPASQFPGLVGWEYHGDPAAIPGLETVASGPTQSAPGQPNGGTYTATIYPGPKGNFVFNAATIWWADGLSAPARLCASSGLYDTQRTGCARPANHSEPAGGNGPA